MKKQVVMLINGFGIEQKRSYAIYDSFLMPNLDACTKEFFFSSLKNESYGIDDALKVFSTRSIEEPNYLKLDSWLDDGGIKNDPVVSQIKSKFENHPGNIHFFCVLSSAQTIKHVKEFLKEVNELKKKKIYLHAVMDFPFTDDYKKLTDYIRTLRYDLDGTAELISVFGRNILEDREDKPSREIVRLLYRRFGELWKQVDQKLTVLENSKVLPKDAQPFFVNNDFEFTDQDLVFIFNYNAVNCSNFVELVHHPNSFMGVPKEFKTVDFLSLFPCPNIPSFYQNSSSPVCFASNIEKIGKKALFVIEQDKVNTANYYLNGFQQKVSPNIRFMAGNMDALLNEQVLKQILTNPDDVIFINYFSDNTDSTEKFKETLKSIDKAIEIVRKICEENNYVFWLTSLYGVIKEMFTDDKESVLVDFNGKVPLILYSPDHLKRSFKLLQGNLFDFQTTLLYMMDSTLKVVPLISKKGIFG